MASRTNCSWSFAFRGYCRLLLALGAIPGIGWSAAEALRCCIPARLRQRAALAYQVSTKTGGVWGGVRPI
jgi:hypothetical protein